MADISRSDALALLAVQNIGTIVKEAEYTSAALSSFRTIRMVSGAARMPVLSALPTAGFVGESATLAAGVKPTSEVLWANKDLIAEEIAVIIPVHENVIDDSTFDIWGEVQPLVSQELGRVLDAAVFFGVNKPATWTDAALVPGAIAAGNTVVRGTSTVDFAEDINQVFAKVEDDGFDVNHAYTGRFMRSKLRGLRDKQNEPIYLDSIRSDNSLGSIYGQPLDYVRNGSWNPAVAELLVGDSSKAILGIRQDVQVKILTEATVGGINLAERDMVALRFKFRAGFAVATPVTTEGSGSKYPFAVLTPSA
ncbi:hypothetical protein B7R22_05370 [Subtercola boreus]|uniref:Phage capsid-like C-terminal domain-containing protein n=1 Tax=Subtercola boreus TaxID=120213 RepID=A0A3E0VWX3_9MICO|nr:phage major capsid protein [Subtercola boreus]RFA14562.1 hypothetical protein B7R21_06345 [Subtercola boreus]RFA15838.1 hypothetical protein B7R22_05370 [Subtercola boreus]